MLLEKTQDRMLNRLNVFADLKKYWCLIEVCIVLLILFKLVVGFVVVAAAAFSSLLLWLLLPSCCLCCCCESNHKHVMPECLNHHCSELHIG